MSWSNVIVVFLLPLNAGRADGWPACFADFFAVGFVVGLAGILTKFTAGLFAGSFAGGVEVGNAGWLPANTLAANKTVKTAVK
ncbi:MAG: hypothetical protein V4692_12655 [Bdellovibrionota bacterium]